jgi:hypothetical protein
VFSSRVRGSLQLGNGGPQAKREESRGRRDCKAAPCTTAEWDVMRTHMHAGTRLAELEAMREQLYVRGYARFYLTDAHETNEAEARGDQTAWSELSTIKPSVQEQLAYEDARCE